MIGYLDTGTIERGLDAMCKATWAQLVVKNVDFFNAGPVAGIPLGQDSMIIFGGQSSKTFIIEDCQAEVNPKTGQASVRTCPATLVQKARFANCCDFYTRSFG